MAVSYANTNGAVNIMDGGTPRVITVKAGENISGGYWVVGSTLKGVVGSGIETYAGRDIIGYTVATQAGSQVIGMALTDMASGTIGPVAMRGLFLVPGLSGTKIGSIHAGDRVSAGSAGTVLGLGSSTVYLGIEGVTMDVSHGTALTAGGILGEYMVVSVNI